MTDSSTVRRLAAAFAGLLVLPAVALGAAPARKKPAKKPPAANRRPLPVLPPAQPRINGVLPIPLGDGSLRARVAELERQLRESRRREDQTQAKLEELQL